MTLGRRLNLNLGSSILKRSIVVFTISSFVRFHPCTLLYVPIPVRYSMYVLIPVRYSMYVLIPVRYSMYVLIPVRYLCTFSSL